MKILLVSINTCTEPFPVYPIGIAVAAQILTKNNHNVQQFDLLTNNENFDYLYEQINNFKPDIIGISIRTIGENSIDLCKLVIDFAHNKNIQVFLAGAGFSLAPDKFIKNTNADFGLIGPGEGNLIEFINDFEQKHNKNKIVNLNKFNKIYGPLFDEKIVKYYSQFDYAIPINTKKGCTHKCSYCVYNFLEGNTIQYRKHDEIIDDIKTLIDKFNVNKIFFCDAIFNDTAGNYKILLEKILKENLSIKWGAYIYPNNISFDDAILMKESGIDLPFLGVDGATDLILKRFNKEFTFDSIIELDETFFKAKIPNSIASFIFGSEVETKASLQEGINNVKKLHFKNFDLHIYVSYLYNLDERTVNENQRMAEEEIIKAFGKTGRVKNIYN